MTGVSGKTGGGPVLTWEERMIMCGSQSRNRFGGSETGARVPAPAQNGPMREEHGIRRHRPG
ncbi:MAG: hypothetical protein OXF56_25280 [Rhodobacteraceae bacterium]|nr:hypothetical protein [Paracoccaceae bacterium]